MAWKSVKRGTTAKRKLVYSNGHNLYVFSQPEYHTHILVRCEEHEDAQEEFLGTGTLEECKAVIRESQLLADLF